MRDRRANKEEYVKRRNEARKICRNKKRETMKNEIEELEIKNGKMKKVLQEIENIKQNL
jgi:hypothetical protein